MSSVGSFSGKPVSIEHLTLTTNHRCSVPSDWVKPHLVDPLREITRRGRGELSPGFWINYYAHRGGASWDIAPTTNPLLPAVMGTFCQKRELSEEYWGKALGTYRRFYERFAIGIAPNTIRKPTSTPWLATMLLPGYAYVNDLVANVSGSGAEDYTAQGLLGTLGSCLACIALEQA